MNDVIATRKKKTTIKIDNTRLPWIAGSLRNHMIRNSGRKKRLSKSTIYG